MTNATDALRDFDEALAWVCHRMKTVPAGRFLVQYENVIRAALQAEVARLEGKAQSYLTAGCEAERRLLAQLETAEDEAARLRENARVLAAFARTAPGRLPVAVQDAVAAMGSANGQ